VTQKNSPPEDFEADVRLLTHGAKNQEELEKAGLALPRFQVNRSILADDMLERMKANIAEFPQVPRFKCKSRIVICGFGPSLQDSWKDIDKTLPILTVSGAHDFLIERGIVPTYHAECDPRDHKTFFLKNSNRRVEYMMASVCHPEMFRMLLKKKRKVTMWHAVTDVYREQLKLLREVEYGAHMVGGGSNAGLRALLLAYHMGFRDFDVHGLDFSYKDRTIWAGPHSGKQHFMMEVECNGREFWSSDVMMNAAQDFFELMHSRYLAGCHFVLHGDGLLVERIKLASVNQEAADHDWVRPLILRKSA
jgi:hypothetical protein